MTWTIIAIIFIIIAIIAIITTIIFSVLFGVYFSKTKEKNSLLDLKNKEVKEKEEEIIKNKEELLKKDNQLSNIKETIKKEVQEKEFLSYKEEINQLIKSQISNNLNENSSFSHKLNSNLNQEFKEKYNQLNRLIQETEKKHNTRFESFLYTSNESKKLFENVSHNIKNINRIFLQGSNKIGMFGESILDWILKGLNNKQKQVYYNQYPLNGNTVDAFLKFDHKNIPNIPIDSKFNAQIYSNLQEAINQGDIKQTKELSEKLLNEFQKNIKLISEKYIKNNSKNNVSFGILFIPSDAVFVYAIEKWRNKLLLFANKHNVVISSPIILSFIVGLLNVFEFNIDINKNTQQIIKEITKFDHDAKKIIELFDQLKKQQNTMLKTFDKLDNSFEKLKNNNIQSKLEKFSKDKGINLLPPKLNKK